MLCRLGDACVGVVRRWLPDPFVFALGLTLITGVRIQARDLMGSVLAPFLVLSLVIGLLVAVMPV